jgi:hypothetical protein
MSDYTNYQNTLTKLQKSHDNLDDTEYCLSLYFDFEPENRGSNSFAEENQTKFKAAFQEALKNFAPLNDFNYIREELTNFVTHLANSLDFRYPGAALFLKFDGQAKSIDSSREDSELVPLTVRPFTTTSVGKYFDLSQLWENDYFDQSKLVVELHENQAKLYAYRQQHLEPLETVPSTYETEEMKKDKYSPVNPDQVPNQFGTGGDKNWQQEAVRAFLENDVLPRVKQNYTNYAQAIVYAGPGLPNDLDEELTSELNKIVKESTCRQKVFSTEAEIREDLVEFGQQEIDQQKSELLKPIQEASHLHAQGLATVAPAVQNGQVERLFYAPKLLETIDQTNLDFYQDQLQAKLERPADLANWLFSQTLELNGQIFSLSSGSMDTLEDVAAELRFQV